MGFIERLGYGIDRMIRLMADAGLPAPRFQETAAGFQVTLTGTAHRLIGEADDTRRWRQLDLNERQEQALAYLAEQGSHHQPRVPGTVPRRQRRDDPARPCRPGAQGPAAQDR